MDRIEEAQVSADRALREAIQRGFMGIEIVAAGGKNEVRTGTSTYPYKVEARTPALWMLTTAPGNKPAIVSHW